MAAVSVASGHQARYTTDQTESILIRPQQKQQKLMLGAGFCCRLGGHIQPEQTTVAPSSQQQLWVTEAAAAAKVASGFLELQKKREMTMNRGELDLAALSRISADSLKKGGSGLEGTIF